MNNITREYPVSVISRLRVGTDGQGVRTLIALAGCPLRCKYCLNKFTWDGTYTPTMLTAEAVHARISKDAVYMAATNGGITFGGGEPIMYPDLIREIRAMSDERLSINVETSLNVPWENVSLIADIVDNFIVDIKALDSDTYKAYTGCKNELVIENLKKLILAGKAEKIVVRVPLIPGFTDEKSQKESEDKLIAMGISRIDKFKYEII